MKKILFVIILSLLCLTLKISAQQTTTNSITPVTQATNVLTGFGASSNVVSAVTTTFGYLIDTVPYIKNGDYLIEIGGLKHGSHWGGLIDFQVPVNTNNWQLTYGAAAAYLDHQAYSGALNISLGTTVTPPLIGNITGPFYIFGESGPGYNLIKNQAVVQSFLGVKYQREISYKLSVVGSYGYGNISDVSGNLQEFTLGFTYKFGAKKAQ